VTTNDLSANGILEEFRIEFLDCWRQLPNKGFFLALAAAWLALFRFVGSSTLGYVHSPSLLDFTLDACHPNLRQWLWTLDVEALSHWAGQADELHCVLIPFVVLGLFWWKRKELMGVRHELWWPGLAGLAGALLVHMFAFMVQQPRLSILAFFAGLYSLMGVAWGRAWLRASFFPFFLLAFCVPLGDLGQVVTFNLRLLVCRLVTWVSNYLLAIDVQREGTILINPAGNYQYEVAAACSGMRSLIATLGLATVFGFVSFQTWWKRGLMVVSAFPFAILGNLARMLAIVVAAEIWGQKGGNYVHEGGPFGIVSLLPYIPAFFGLALLGNWLRGRPPPPSASAARGKPSSSVRAT
jgi:exosortase